MVNSYVDVGVAVKFVEHIYTAGESTEVSFAIVGFVSLFPEESVAIDVKSMGDAKCGRISYLAIISIIRQTCKLTNCC